MGTCNGGSGQLLGQSQNSRVHSYSRFGCSAVASVESRNSSWVNKAAFMPEQVPASFGWVCGAVTGLFVRLHFSNQANEKRHNQRHPDDATTQRRNDATTEQPQQANYIKVVIVRLTDIIVNERTIRRTNERTNHRTNEPPNERTTD